MQPGSDSVLMDMKREYCLASNMSLTFSNNGECSSILGCTHLKIVIITLRLYQLMKNICLVDVFHH